MSFIAARMSALPSSAVSGAASVMAAILSACWVCVNRGSVPRMDYDAFLARKRREWTGAAVPDATVPAEGLRDFQARLTAWALRKGRAALFADTGLGKTRMQVAWALAIPGRVLILTPLCVAPQTIAEARILDVDVQLLGSGAR